MITWFTDLIDAGCTCIECLYFLWTGNVYIYIYLRIGFTEFRVLLWKLSIQGTRSMSWWVYSLKKCMCNVHVPSKSKTIQMQVVLMVQNALIDWFPNNDPPLECIKPWARRAWIWLGDGHNPLMFRATGCVSVSVATFQALQVSPEKIKMMVVTWVCFFAMRC